MRSIYLLLVLTIAAFANVYAADSADNSFRDCPDCPEMITIPAGSLDMGSPSDEAGRNDNEGPIHRVNIRSFALGKTTITRGQFAAFISETDYDAGNKCFVKKGEKFEEHDGRSWRDPGYAQDDTHPVTCINWYDAQAYAAWLSRKTGKQYHLPTEAEWEYATRAGTKTIRYWGDSPDQACSYANVGDQTMKSQMPGVLHKVHNCTDGFAYTSPVGSFKPNAFGLYDMLGNVWQWMEDGWHDSYNGASADGSALKAAWDANRVARGGSWYSRPQSVRTAYRRGLRSLFRFNNYGFRLARALP